MAAYTSPTSSKYKQMWDPLSNGNLDLIETDGHYEEQTRPGQTTLNAPSELAIQDSSFPFIRSVLEHLRPENS